MEQIRIRTFLHSIKFINKFLKNGKKYRLFKFLKNSLIFYIIVKFLVKKRINMWLLSKNIVELELLNYITPTYGLIIKVIKKKKKKIKEFRSFFMDENHKDTYKELFRLWYPLMYKLPIRTIQLRLFYYIYVLYVYGGLFHEISDYPETVYDKTRVIKELLKKKKKNFFSDIVISMNILNFIKYFIFLIIFIYLYIIVWFYITGFLKTFLLFIYKLIFFLKNNLKIFLIYLNYNLKKLKIFLKIKKMININNKEVKISFLKNNLFLKIFLVIFSKFKLNFKNLFIFFKQGVKKNSFFNIFFLNKKRYSYWFWKIR